MTVDKRDEPDQRSDELNNSGTVSTGFSDPSGQFPRQDYFFEAGTNKAARSRKRNELSIGGGLDGTSVDLPPVGESQYPYNDVRETQSGHVVEYDDTPGAERILIKHRTGSGVELRADGSMVMKTENNLVQSVAGSSVLIVEGDTDLKVNGNLSLTVAGDLNLNVGGSINTTVAGNKTEQVNGSSRELVYGTRGSVVKGSRSHTTVGTYTDTALAGRNDIVKGNYRQTIQGDGSYAVSGTIKMTGESKMIMSSNDMNIGAQSLSVFGASGTIGGAGIVHYGVTYYGTSFYGDLRGTALKAVTADVTNSQNYSADATGTASGYSATDDGTATASASSSTMDAYLNKSAYGTAKVKIDEGDFLKKMIDRTEDNIGVSDRTLNIREVRSAMREPKTAKNTKFTGTYVSSGVLSNTFSRTVPSKINRLSSKTGNVRLPSNPINDRIDRTARYKPTKNINVTKFVPSPAYDPNLLPDTTPITGNITIGRGIKLARFLGPIGEKVTMAQLPTREARLAVARQFVLQANAVSTVLDNQGEFKDYRLVTVEGLYVQGPSEELTTGSFNERATRGEVVVYELHDKNGQIDLAKTYDLATYWKDSLLYDKLSLSYDTYDSGKLVGQIILTMPEIDSSYNLVNGRYGNQIETLFNGNVQGNELIEITSA